MLPSRNKDDDDDDPDDNDDDDYYYHNQPESYDFYGLRYTRTYTPTALEAVGLLCIYYKLKNDCVMREYRPEVEYRETNTLVE